MKSCVKETQGSVSSPFLMPPPNKMPTMSFMAKNSQKKFASNVAESSKLPKVGTNNATLKCALGGTNKINPKLTKKVLQTRMA